MIAILDYGMGNLHSVGKAVERLGYETAVSSDPKEIMSADGAILPGVGAFSDAMDNLRETGLDEVVTRFAQSGKPLLGICLGMQLLFTESEEHGPSRGLGLLPGSVVRFRGNYKVPHMGWNRLAFRKPSPLFEGLDEGYVYFVHSYHVKPEEPGDLLAVTDYYQPVTAIVGRGNVYGMQFHPEKSGALGMGLLGNFLALTGSRQVAEGLV
ncbi:imidazole glycerol phosphate synthase subunit HisH [Paenibacillus cisolokensis]|uniref:Imidazole glycerol phosphate synthase subunit HisH n=1 Tax=Paenibacillus cisolokensis TaxID=1658519 RepID=A0ABQ4NBJ5_9BACL|nr:MULTISPECIES: imidazole glycerol phosphate synthase subunit HisH [Paenibacillus]ALS25631.1 imidazole glycerol phosphate synthase [Paenibacillus sp. 32O-W]GIQ65610.1 imidazole glycerol phosphate synthase subunit HisH [Paenibacillus cisolokensis]